MKKRILKRFVALLLVVMLVVPSITMPASAGITTFVATKASTVVVTVMGRQFAKLMKSYSETDNLGSGVAGLVYQYMAGPTGMKLGAILDATKEISAQLDEIEAQLTEMEDRIEGELRAIEGILTQGEVYDEQARITAITSFYEPAYERYEMLMEEMDKNNGDMNGDGKTDDADMALVNERYAVIFKNLPDRDFKDDMTALADIISDSGGGVSTKANETGVHNSNDQTYIKAVKVDTQQNVPFADQVSVATAYAGAFTIQKQVQMLTLYVEIMGFLKGQLEGNTALSPTLRYKYQSTYDMLSANYENVYNMTLNSMNNACEQMDVDKMMSYLDRNIKDPQTGMQLQQVQMNRAIENGVSYTTGGVYYIPRGTLRARDMFSEVCMHTSRDDPHSDHDIEIEDMQYQSTSKTNKLIRKDNPDDPIQPVKSVSEAKELFGSYMLESSGSMTAVDYLRSYGVDIGSVDDFIFSLTPGMETISKDYDYYYFMFIPFVSREYWVSTQKGQMLEGSRYTESSKDSDIKTKHVRDLYLNNENVSFILKNKSEKPSYNIQYKCDANCSVSSPTSVKAGELVTFRPNYASPQYNLVEVTGRRSNGEELNLNVNEVKDASGNTFEFIMPYQDVVIEIKTSANSSRVNKKSEHGTINCADRALWGDMVQLGYTPSTGYVFDSVSVADADGKAIKVENDQFKMPKKDVTVTAAFRPMDSFAGILTGEGTEQNPYRIRDLTEWNVLASSLYAGEQTKGLYFTISSPLDLSGGKVVPLGTEENPFEGTLMGKYRFIGGFSDLDSDGDYNALIPYLGSAGTVRDVQFDTVTLNGGSKPSAIIGRNQGTVSDCVSSINGGTGSSAGFVVRNEGTIVDCWYTGNSVTGGGIALHNEGTISGCANHGVVKGMGTGNGGIVASNGKGGVIDQCANEGDLTVFGEMVSMIGGIAGINDGTIINCTNKGTVGTAETSYVGGLVGEFSSGKLVNSYNYGTVQGSMVVGGLVGYTSIGKSDSSSITNCYSSGSIKTSADSLSEKYVGALIGLVGNGSWIAISMDPADLNGQVSQIIASSSVKMDGLSPIANYSENALSEDVAKYADDSTLNSSAMTNQLNACAETYNAQGRSEDEPKAVYWTQKSDREAGLSDIPAGAWYTEAVRYVFDNGIMQGTGDGKFEPDAVLTRAELVQILYNKAGKPDADKPSTFTDVPATQWYANAIAWAQQNNVVDGSGNQFAPDEKLTREQFAAMMYRSENRPAVSGALSFKDAADVSDWAKDAMLWVTQNKVITDAQQSDGTPLLKAKLGVTRAEAAAMLMKFCENAEK